MTKRAMKLKSETELSAGGPVTEHAETEIRADDALAETHRVATESTASEHASAEFCVEDAMAETLRWIKAISVSYTHLTLPTNREV